MVLLSLPNALLTSPILRSTSNLLPGVKLPRKINLFTFLIGLPPKLTFWSWRVYFTFVSIYFHCNFSNIRDIRVVSSAYLRLVIRFSPANQNSSGILSISSMTNSNNILNNFGDNKHPCLKPKITTNYSVSFPSMITQHWVFSYKLLIMLMIFALTPMFLTIFRKAFLHNVSKQLWSQ